MTASIFTPSVSPPTRAMVPLRCSTGWSMNKVLKPRVAVSTNPSGPTGPSPGRLHYDHERNIYVCPAGKHLTTSGTLVNDCATMFYRGSKADCSACTQADFFNTIGQKQTSNRE